MSVAPWKLLGIVACAASLVAGAPRANAEWVDWIADADLAFEYTDNLNNSSFSADEEHDSGWFPALEGGRVFQLTDRTRASISATIAGEFYHRFDDLDALDVGGRLALFHKFGIGNALWVRPYFWGGYKHIRAGVRSGERFEVGFNAGKRFSPRFDVALDYHFTDRDGRSDVFEQDYHLLTLVGNFLLLEPLLVTTGYSFRVGDFDSACTPGNVGRVLGRRGREGHHPGRGLRRLRLPDRRHRPRCLRQLQLGLHRAHLARPRLSLPSTERPRTSTTPATMSDSRCCFATEP